MTAQPRPDQSIDPNLLFRRMGMRQVDPSDLERDNPLLFHELQGVCASCLSKEECAQNLAQKLTTPDGMNGVRIVRIPQCCALCGGTQLSNGLNRRFFCASHDASSSSRLLDGLHALTTKFSKWLFSAKADVVAGTGRSQKQDTPL